MLILAERFRRLPAKFPEAPVYSMGFPKYCSLFSGVMRKQTETYSLQLWLLKHIINLCGSGCKNKKIFTQLKVEEKQLEVPHTRQSESPNNQTLPANEWIHIAIPRRTQSTLYIQVLVTRSMWHIFDHFYNHSHSF